LGASKLSRFIVAAAERRSHGRRRGNLAAKLALGTTAADCTIRDLSHGGARIEAPSVGSLPDEVYLLILDDGIVVRARCAWADLPWFGLKFLDAEAIEDCTRPQCEPLKRVWRDRTSQPLG